MPRCSGSATSPLRPGARVLVKSGTSTVQALVPEIVGRRDLDSLALEPADGLEINDIGQVRVRLAAELPVEEYAAHRRAGAFLVIDPQSGATLAAGIVTAPVTPTTGHRPASSARPPTPKEQQHDRNVPRHIPASAWSAA